MCRLFPWYSACIAGNSVLDPDLQIRWGAGQSPKIFFQPFRLQFGLQIKGGLGPQPLPWIHYWNSSLTGAELGFWSCFTKSDVFFFRMSSECGGRNKPTRSLHGLIIYAMWNLVIKFQQKLMGACSTPYVYEFLVPCRVNYSILVTKRTWSTADVRSCNWSK